MYPSRDEYTNIAAPPSYDASISTTYPSAPAQGVEYKSREERFRELVDKHEISLDFSQRLQQLQGFKVVFIFDDSGSMNAP